MMFRMNNNCSDYIVFYWPFPFYENNIFAMYIQKEFIEKNLVEVT